ncbi:hypothetical protein D8780_03330 [Notoacmeibacter ruber]|uniref:Lipopolysaccharide biosynthesis protein n=1 Tax=Notoacmeibacter ruber TaxID=2670375 RepID=A0A3L7J9M1_9HYPH|nr:hypothetical protein D8780_03330 [Notoacmeibacter ruber]
MKRLTFTIVGFQGFWAVSQALIILAVSRLGGLEYVGFLVLGLAIFTPICLATGFNLRSQLAIDNEGKIDIWSAITARTISVTISLLVTSLTLLILADGNHRLWLVSTLLVASRCADQIADVATGYYQRADTPLRIGYSLTGRAIASIMPLVTTASLGGSMIAAASTTLVATVSVVLLIDVIPILRTTGSARTARKPFLSGVTLHSAPYPFFDAMFMNSLRYMALAFLGTDALGQLGIVQSLYAPIQLILTATGYTYLTSARSLVAEGDRIGLAHHIRRGILYGIVGSSLFVTAAISVPPTLLGAAFLIEPSSLHHTLIVFAFAVFPLPCGSFIASNRMANHQHGLMTASVLIPSAFLGIFFLWASFQPSDMITIEIIFAAFFVCSTCRVAILLARRFEIDRSM